MKHMGMTFIFIGDGTRLIGFFGGLLFSVKDECINPSEWASCASLFENCRLLT